MKKLIKKKKLGRKASHRKSLRYNLIRSLVKHGKVETTSVKAKVLKSDFESLLSSIKDFDVKTTRRLMTILGSKELVAKLRNMDKDMRISIRKIGFRDGDNAEMSRVSILSKTKAVSSGDKEK